MKEAVQKIRATAKMPDDTAIQLEDWSDVYPDNPELAWVIGAYPNSVSFGRKGRTFRLTISFDTDSEAVGAFEALNRGEKTLADYRDKFWNGKKDEYRLGLIDYYAEVL